ncbi:MAG: sugar transferase, partial [Streptococcus vestibularis]
MKEKQEIRRIEIGLVQLVVVVFAAWLASKLPYTEITKGSIVLLGVVHVVTYYISSYFENLKYRGYLDELIATVKYGFIFALIATFLSFFSDGDFSISRRGLLYVTLIACTLLYLTNTLLRYFRSSIYTRRKGNKNILLISDQARLEDVLIRMKDNMDGRITAVCVLDNPYFTSPFIKSVKPENLVEYATHSVVDQVLINLPSEQYKIWDYASPFELMGIPVSINLNSLDFMSQGKKRIQQLGPFNVVTFSTQFYSYGDIVAKRFLDICGALFGLLLCGLVGIFLYPLIRRDGGPAIFVQDRVGENGRIFKFYKFRSMRVDAEEIKKNLMSQNKMSGGMFKMDNDPRITKIGHFIRKTSLDELPQFWNVLKGDMSLVGTRPPTLD